MQHDSDCLYGSEACPVCWETFKDPVVLNCGHTFDKKCVAALIVCPLCRQLITSKVINWQVLDMIERSPSVDFQADPDNLSSYRIIDDLSLIQPGTRIAYTLKKCTPTIHKVWLHHLGTESIYVYSGSKIVEIPTGRLDKTWYHPGCHLETDEMKADCCVVV